MRIIIESFILFFILTFISLLSIEYIAVNKEISTARSFHSACIDSIENSYYDSTTISRWITMADKYGFRLNVINLSKEENEKVIPCYYVSLNYQVNINLLGISEESTIKGYAR